MKYKKWTDEDHELLRCMSEAGFTAREIATELDCSENTVKHKKSVLGISTRSNSYKPKYHDTKTGGNYGGGRPKKYTKEQLIEIMKAAPIHTYDYFNSKDSGLPAGTTYRAYFGSWESALIAAGLDPNESTMKENVPTTVYLLDFGDFYKIGITQQPLNKRFGSRYPAYHVVLTMETSLQEARLIEKQWLDAVKQYQYVPSTFPYEGGGHTECFKLD